MRLTYLAVLSLSFLLAFCSKGPDTAEQPGEVDPPSPPEIKGVLYTLAISGGITAIDLQTQTVLWNNPGSYFDVPLTYIDGVIYSHGISRIKAIDAVSGATLWTRSIGGSYSTGVQHQARVAGRDSLLYAVGNGTGFDATAYLSCLYKATGEIRWKKKLMPYPSPAEMYGTPLVIGDKVIACGLNNGHPRNVVWCFNRLSGDMIWVKDLPDNVLNPQPFTYDSTQVQFTAYTNGDNLISLDINTGIEQFRVPGFSPVGTPFGYRPAYRNNKLVLFNSQGSAVALMNPGGQLEEPMQLSMYGAELDENNRIYFTDNSYRLSSLDLTNRRVDWAKESPAKIYLDSLFMIQAPSHRSRLVTNGKYVCYYQLVRDFPRLLINSLYFHDALTGDLIKEIKFTDNTFGLGSNMLIVVDGKAY